jgi:hypothetical protein
MFYERASGPRRLRMGEGMVTAVRPVTVTYRDGSVERLVPHCTNFDPSHPLVRQRPELFQLCRKDDRTTAPQVFRDVLRAAERELTRPSSRASRPRPGSGLRSGRESRGRYQLG